MNPKLANLKIALGQIKIITGDLQGNTNKIVDGIQKAIEEKVDIIVFPELAITGYNCGMMFKQQHFIDYNLYFLDNVIVPKVPDNLIVIVGFVDCIGRHSDSTPNIQNSLAVIQGGKILNVYAKILLANGGHHDDSHYFTPGNYVSTINVKIKDQIISLGTLICEDVWSQDHERNLVKEIKQNGAELLVVLNQSFFYYGKQSLRKQMYQDHASQNQLPIIAVNSIGVGDINKNFMIYDGGSMICMPNGRNWFTKQFEEEIDIVQLNDQGNIPGFSRGGVPIVTEKYDEIFQSLVFAQKHIFSDLGIAKAQVHISGGIDSSVVLPIVVEAMGKENVIAISNPSQYNGNVTKNNAQLLCDALGVHLYWNEIGTVQTSLIDSHKKAFGEDSVKPLVVSTFDAVGRTVQGLAASHFFNTGLVSASNHTEIVLGWVSFHDISCAAVYSIIGDLTKVEVYELAKYINKKYNKELIPSNLYDGTTAPAAELADTKEDPFDYFVVSGICALLIRKMKSIDEIIDLYDSKKLPEDYFPLNNEGKNIYSIISFEDFKNQVLMCFNRCKISVYKTAQSAPIVMISPISRGFSSRETIINKYKGKY